ncbi:hypothetical protein KEM55_004444 [Ascosphaera atra]|nr:hypothetical protein KEM55_004444 [Ascosphaera atra]
MSPRLTIQRSSPTTVRFTVSDAPLRCTFTAHALFCLELILRVSIFLLVLLINAAEARHYVAFLRRNNGRVLPCADLWMTGLGAAVTRVADRHSWAVVAVGSAVVLHLIFSRGYTEESILVIRGLGIQTSTSSPIYFCRASTRFIPTMQIRDIIIHEAFKGFEVKFYLALLVEGESEVVVVFPVCLIQLAFEGYK